MKARPARPIFFVKSPARSGPDDVGPGPPEARKRLCPPITNVMARKIALMELMSLLVKYAMKMLGCAEIAQDAS